MAALILFDTEPNLPGYSLLIDRLLSGNARLAAGKYQVCEASAKKTTREHRT
jgi:hypothetical protein